MQHKRASVYSRGWVEVASNRMDLGPAISSLRVEDLRGLGYNSRRSGPLPHLCQIR